MTLPPRSVAIAVMVPTLDEERNIAACLASVAWAEQFIVVDSGSTDRTAEFARAAGAEVVTFDYKHDSPTGWPKKKNWALRNAPWRHEWVFILDADERVTQALGEEIARVVADPKSLDGYWVNRLFYFKGKPIRHCGYYPSYNVRLMRHRLARYERIADLGDTGSGDHEIHEHVIIEGDRVGYLRGEMKHFAYPDAQAWRDKHARYANWEALAMLAQLDRRHAPDEMRGSFASGPIARRRWLKRLSRRLPFRPTLRFLYGYVLRAGFLDGTAGLELCRLMADYERMIDRKLRELRSKP